MALFTDKIVDTKYKVELYDWDVRQDKYLVGYVKRSPSKLDSDMYFWRFYPSNDLAPICAGDLDRLASFIRELNSGID